MGGYGRPVPDETVLLWVDAEAITTSFQLRKRKSAGKRTITAERTIRTCSKWSRKRKARKAASRNGSKSSTVLWLKRTKGETYVLCSSKKKRCN